MVSTGGRARILALRPTFPMSRYLPIRPLSFELKMDPVIATALATGTTAVVASIVTLISSFRSRLATREFSAELERAFSATPAGEAPSVNRTPASEVGDYPQEGSGAEKRGNVFQLHNVADRVVSNFMDRYHSQALLQAWVWFGASVLAAALGLIITGIAVAEAVSNPSRASVVQVISGVASDAIAVLFFRQAGQTRDRATEMLDRLRSDDSLRHAVNIVHSIEGLDLRDQMKASIALHVIRQGYNRHHRDSSQGESLPINLPAPPA